MAADAIKLTRKLTRQFEMPRTILAGAADG